jgi:hypothetical protein
MDWLPSMASILVSDALEWFCIAAGVVGVLINKSADRSRKRDALKFRHKAHEYGKQLPKSKQIRKIYVMTKYTINLVRFCR